MKHSVSTPVLADLARRWTCLAVLALCLSAGGAAEEPAGDYRLVEFEGKVEVMRAGASVWDQAYTNQVLLPGDQLRTLDHSRAVIRWSDLTLERLGERSRIQIPEKEKTGAVIEFFRGILYFFHRDEPGEFDVKTPRVAAVVRGTEFVLEVEEDGTTRLTLVDGAVEMTNEFGSLSLQSGEEALVEPGQAPQRTAVVSVRQRLQWNLYYPAVLNLDELELSAAEKSDLSASLEAYRSGDLLRALAAYPEDRAPFSPEEKVYRAALLLAVGSVAEAERWLGGLPQAGTRETTQRLAFALRHMMAAVRGEPRPPRPPRTATEWLAQSYMAQSQNDLPGAREAAREALNIDPHFAWALARSAELAFSFGEIARATGQVEESLALAPRHAQAHALRGFLLAARHQSEEALAAFNQALEIDSALGNAWLGRGLVRIRERQEKEGLDDIQVAATVEPQRALPRSYLGKAYSAVGKNAHALQEIDLARRLDPADPTAWLYGALIKQQENRINEAVEDLEASIARNDNRAVYRSRLLLDQDRAVRNANLANVYADAGLESVSLREAARGVTASYANHSSHLFLANSYSQRLDPGRVTLRFETAAVSEYLLANLLAPVGAGPLSPTVSQQEYSRLFDRDGWGLVSRTEYLSRGAWSQEGAVYGTWDNTSVSFDTLYLHDNGQTPNNDLELTTYSARLKQRVSAQGHLLGQVLWSHSEGGDLAPHYDPRALATQGVNPFVRVEERQEPIALAGYHHEWAPGHHTLFLASRLQDELEVDDPLQSTLLLDRSSGSLTGANAIGIDQDYESELEIYSAEAQQILERGPSTLVAGGRYQVGEFDAFNRHTPTSATGQPASLFTTLANDISSDFERGTLYAYYHYRLLEPLLLVGGVAYDHLVHPENFRFAPLAEDEESVDQVSPKAGLVWSPSSRTTLRASYSRFLGGVSFDQSFRLEPSQVAGINQAYRSVIPDAVTGANAAEEADAYGLIWDQELPSRTYVSLGARWLRSEVQRDIGVYEATPPAIGVFPLPPFIIPSVTEQSLDYDEQSVGLTVNQLVGEEWAFGIRYELTHSELDITFRDLPASATTTGFSRRQELEAFLHQARLFGIFNHPSGFFAKGETLWFQQSNQGYSPDIPGDDFWQFNLFAGYRFWQRRAEVMLGILNVGDQDYRLNPLNVTANLPRERTFMARFRFNF